MKISQVYNIMFDAEESIITATLSAPNELILLMSSGNVIRYNMDDLRGQFLFSVKSSFNYEDGGFDINAKSTIYTLDSIVVIVNDFKLHGFIHYPGEYKKMHLLRKDNHSDFSCYPIALFKSEAGIPHLIYAEAWNHLEIMNLDSRQILTAAKSLIEENAEESHLEYFKNNTIGDEFSWPRPYDYFYGKLVMSPSTRCFLSAGWVWGSFDSYRVYDVEDFIKNNRIADVKTGNWEHSNRAVCWIDDDTIAVAYSPFDEEEEHSSYDSKLEIHFYKFDNRKSALTRKIQVNGLNIMNSEFYFNVNLNAIIVLSNKEGVALLSLDGEVLFKDENLNSAVYCSAYNLFVKTDNNKLSVCRIENDR